MVGEGLAIIIPAGCQPREGGGAWLTGSLEPQEGVAPLHLAVTNGHEAIVGALLKAGADKESKNLVGGGRVQGESGAVLCGFVSVRFEQNDAST